MMASSPLSKDYLAGAIGESGAGIHPTLPPTPLADAEKAGMDFAKMPAIQHRQPSHCRQEISMELYDESKVLDSLL